MKAAEPIYREAYTLGIDHSFEVLKTIFTNRKEYNIQADFMIRNPAAENYIHNRPIEFSQTWAPRVSSTTNTLIRDQLELGFARMENIPKLQARVREVYAESAQWRSLLIARTETIRSFSEGTVDYYKKSTVIKELEFNVAPDERLCEECAGHSGEKFSVEQASGFIPVHPLCRCTWLPVVPENLFGEQRAVPFSPLNMPEVPVNISPSMVNIPSPPITGVTPLENAKVLNTGISETYIGEVNGQRFVFKAQQGAHDHIEREVMMSKLMNKVGLNAPKTEFGEFIFNPVARNGVRIGEQVKAMTKMNFVEQAQVVHNLPSSTVDWIVQHPQEIRKMQAMDALVGNVDRHAGNYMIGEATNNYGKLFPIDHNLSFYTNSFTKDLQRLESFHNMTRSSTTTEIFQHTTIEEWKQVAAEIKATLNPEDFKIILDDIPSTYLSVAEKSELLDIFTWRLEHLDEILEAATRRM